MIPRYPQKIDGSTIEMRLRAEGDETTTRRTIQRDLEKLASLFPIACHDKTKPYGWFWIKDAPTFAMPGMDPVTALTFHLAERHLSQLFPHSAMDALRPYLESARRFLDQQSENRLQRWPGKVCTISRGQPLRSPKVKGNVVEVVYEALLKERRFHAMYRKRGESELHEYVVNPLGMVVQDQVTYLVASLWDYEEPILMVLHRFEQVDLLDEACIIPDGFSLQKYVNSGEFQFPEGGRPIKLEVLFGRYAGAHLLETPLSTDQKVTERKDGRLLIKATVADTEQLRWWLLGFGENAEVVRPKRLREEFAQISHIMYSSYR